MKTRQLFGMLVLWLIGATCFDVPAYSAEQAKVRIETPSGQTLKITKRKTNTSKQVLLTVNKDTVVEQVKVDPPPPPPPPPPVSKASPDGTRGVTYIDNEGATWTIGADGFTYRNGVNFNNGWARGYLWSKGVGYHQGVGKYPDGFHHWFSWNTATKSWQDRGANDPETGKPPVVVVDPPPPPPPPPPPAPPPTPVSGELRSITTTGSITAGSNQLTVANVCVIVCFANGDFIIVEIGKEPGEGKRGTKGVGGTWPARSWPNGSVMNNDTQNHPAGTDDLRAAGWVENTGDVFLMSNNRSFRVPADFYIGAYYMTKVIPLSLQAQITAISGNTLTLSKSAVVGAAGANVYLDNAPIITKMIVDAPNGVTLPAGRHVVGGIVQVTNRTGFTFAGSGQDQTTLWSPKGVPSASIQAWNSPSTTVKDLTLEGNWGDDGYGLNLGGSTGVAAGGRALPVSGFSHGTLTTFGIGILNGSHNSKVQDVLVKYVPQGAVRVAYANNIWAYRVKNIQIQIPYEYVQWQIQWTDTVGGGCVDCEIDSTWLMPGFEAFKSNGVQFIRSKGKNALFSMNGTGAFLIEDADLTFTAGNLHPASGLYAASAGHPIININNNIRQPLGLLVDGGTIRNTKMTQDGYIDAKNNSLRGISINEPNPNVKVEGGSYQAPDFKEPAIYGPAAFSSQAANTNVDGFRAFGKPKPGEYSWNIFVPTYLGGSLTNCVAEKWFPPAANCKTPAQAGLSP